MVTQAEHKIKENSGERLKCKYCGKPFIRKREWQKFCCPSHQKQYWKDIIGDRYNLAKRVEKLEEKLRSQ